MNIEQKLFKAATKLIEERFPTGQGSAAAMCTEDGTILTSIAPETINPSTEVCVETGSICEAHKLNKVVTHTICVIREHENSEYKILTPCGVCQERLFFWGPYLKAAVYDEKNMYVYKTLEELQPYYWWKSYEKQAGIQGTKNK
ncbi:cytidine deaminase [Paenibacillus taihuensis]|nr:cytidine deaminase [Paenibacillus taihuensis]